MSGYPPNNASGYNYGAPPPAQPYPAAPYGAPTQPAPYGAHPAPYGQPQHDPNKPAKNQHGQPSAPYGGPAPAAPYAAQPGYTAPAYGSPFASLVPSNFPPGTDPNVISTFQMADRDGSGFIDDLELQKALTTYRETFSLRTVHLLMYLFTNTNTRKIGIYIYLSTVCLFILITWPTINIYIYLTEYFNCR